jgi:hypothetical protein
VTLVRKQHGQRRAPRTRADNADFISHSYEL